MSTTGRKTKYKKTQPQTEKVAKVKKKLFEDVEISEKDNIEDTPNKNIEKINKKLFERQKEAKKIPVSSNKNDGLLFPLNMPGDEILIRSGELNILNECPDVNENSFLDPAEQQTSEKNKRPSRKRKRQPETWKRNDNKIKRERGEEYTEAKGKYIQARIVRPGCESTCKLMCSDEISEKDNIEDTPHKNIVKINRKLYERQKEAKKIPVSSNKNDCLLIPLNMPGDEILIPSGELPILNECPDVNENSLLDPSELQISEKNKKPSRKRKRQPETWKRNVNKIKRERGEEYTGAKGKCMPARIVKPGCQSTCKLMCSTNFTSALREKIKSEFYSLTDAQKYKFYGKYTTRTKKSRTRTKSERSKRSYTFHYYFRKEDEVLKVCRNFFCSTLSISARRIHYFHLKMEKSDALLPPTPRKGKYVKKETPPEKVNEVIDHIKSFPTVDSHYCRSSSTRQNLQPELSVSKMYSLYVEKHKDPVKENIYRKIFCERFNLGFHHPKKDVSDFCSEFKAQKNSSSDLIEKYEEHLQRKKEGDEEREKDRNLTNSKNNDTAVVTFDLENIFSLPKANVSCFFYTSKLTVYNLTAHCDINKNAVNALWDETRNGRSGDDLASALVKILKEIVSSLPDTITKLILWSDSCVPQNRNSHMSTALIKFLQSDDSKYITSITQKYSEPGHGNLQEVDSVHSLIERNLRHTEIYSPLSLLRALLKIKSNTLKLFFLQMEDADFLSFHSEAIKFGFYQIPYKRVKSLTYSKKEWYVIKYQTSFSGPTETIDIRKNQINVLSEITLKEANKTLTKKKIEDIRRMFQYMPTEDKVFMDTLIKKTERRKGEKENLDSIKPDAKKETKRSKNITKTLTERKKTKGGKDEKTINEENKTKIWKNEKETLTKIDETKHEKKTITKGNKTKKEKSVKKATEKKTITKINKTKKEKSVKATEKKTITKINKTKKEKNLKKSTEKKTIRKTNNK